MCSKATARGEGAGGGCRRGVPSALTQEDNRSNLD